MSSAAAGNDIYGDIRDFINSSPSTSKSTQQLPRQDPESPNIKDARQRLDNLLSTIGNRIRNGETVSSDEGAMENQLEPPLGGEEVKRRPGRPLKKQKREKRVVFDLRDKRFGLRDQPGLPEPSIYALCRKWLYGKDDELETESAAAEAVRPPQTFRPTRNLSLDLLATKDIYALPSPRPNMAMVDPCPQRVVHWTPRAVPMEVDGDGNENGMRDAMLADYKPHWKNVKDSWYRHKWRRQQRYSDSLKLLRTVQAIYEAGREDCT